MTNARHPSNDTPDEPAPYAHEDADGVCQGCGAVRSKRQTCFCNGVPDAASETDPYAPTNRHDPAAPDAWSTIAPRPAVPRRRGTVGRILVPAVLASVVVTIVVAVALALSVSIPENGTKTRLIDGPAPSASTAGATEAEIAICENAVRAKMNDPDAGIAAPECEKMTESQREASTNKLALEALAGNAPTGENEANPSDVYKFGQTVAFEDGSTLIASAPVKFSRAEYAAGGESFRQFVKFKITFTNKSGQVFDPTLTFTQVSSGETEGDEIFQDGLGSPSNKVLPGKKISWWSGYGVENAKDCQLTVQMGFLDYPDVTFVP